MPENPRTLVRDGMDPREALKITDNIYQAVGFGNTCMVTTPEGNVIIDTSMPAPAKYIILTHGDGDHTGGVPLWKMRAGSI